MAINRMVKGKKIVRNRARCARCGTVIESVDTTDTVYCECLGIHISGGTKKLLRGGELTFCEELSVLQ